ncbi:Rap1 Myb domain-containing protein [Cladorrhinum samala]|uniref:DNA-binding protein RAP1 n=1 Tax=Cladorrhinum samala TaxID=585594 RepID=A0AAV9HCI4_9PEZI|nr:Rap1 Myb domain-containing protein [Cladorrhinum samala]
MPEPAAAEGETDNRYEGTIFGGIKFWLSFKVPSRSTFADKLKNNGAKLVQLEKFADVLIGDELRPETAPPNALSYKFIDACIAEGELVDAEEFRLAKGLIVRPVGSTKPTKGVRTRFTPADDQILVSWVHQHQRLGASISGNKIYQELAERYPNHTWQSWQSRWVKTLCLWPQDLLPETIQLPPPSAPTVLSGNARPTPTPAPASAPAPARARAPSSTPARAPGLRTPFTPEDDRMLFEYVQDRMRQGAKVRGNVIYKEFEEEHPHHTFQAWRDRYIKYLSSRHPDEFLDAPREPKAQPRALVQSRTPAPQSSTPASTSIPAPHPPASRRPALTQPQRSRAKSSTPAASISGESRTERLRRIQGAKRIQRAWSKYRLRRTLAQRISSRKEEQALKAREPVFPLMQVELEQQLKGHGLKFSVPVEDDIDAIIINGPKPRFPKSEQGLRMFLELLYGEEFSFDGDVLCEVGEETVNVFEFWNAAMVEFGPGSSAGPLTVGDSEWARVAQRLGLQVPCDIAEEEEDASDHDVIEELRDAFRRYGLLEAWMAMRVFDQREWEGVELGGSV